MPASRFRWLAAAVGFTLILAGCGRAGHDEMAWARRALERNPNLEIVASDAQRRTFTVRARDSGALQVVRADQIEAMPQQTTAAVVIREPAVGPRSPTVSPAGVEESAGATEGAAQARHATASLPEAGAHAVPALPTQPPANGRVLEKGPGYSIESAPSASAETPATRPRSRESSVTSAAVERRHDPIVCQGAQLLHIDNRNLVFDGDGVSAEDGCEIHITNSHISATGVGIQARAADVHIDNSQIEGDEGSIDAADGAQVYATASRFRGLSRRLDSASVHDLGGNIWN